MTRITYVNLPPGVVPIDPNSTEKDVNSEPAPPIEDVELLASLLKELEESCASATDEDLPSRFEIINGYLDDDDVWSLSEDVEEEVWCTPMGVLVESVLTPNAATDPQAGLESMVKGLETRPGDKQPLPSVKGGSIAAAAEPPPRVVQELAKMQPGARERLKGALATLLGIAEKERKALDDLHSAYAAVILQDAQMLVGDGGGGWQEGLESALQALLEKFGLERAWRDACGSDYELSKVGELRTMVESFAREMVAFDMRVIDNYRNNMPQFELRVALDKDDKFRRLYQEGKRWGAEVREAQALPADDPKRQSLLERLSVRVWKDYADLPPPPPEAPLLQRELVGDPLGALKAQVSRRAFVRVQYVYMAAVKAWMKKALMILEPHKFAEVPFMAQPPAKLQRRGDAAAPPPPLQPAEVEGRKTRSAALRERAAPAVKELFALGSSARLTAAPSRPGPTSAAARRVLTAWLNEHFVPTQDYPRGPFPTLAVKRELAAQTGLSVKQVGDWFVNARARKVVPKLEALMSTLDECCAAAAEGLAAIPEEAPAPAAAPAASGITTAQVVVVSRSAASEDSCLAPATPALSDATLIDKKPPVNNNDDCCIVSSAPPAAAAQTAA